MTLVRIKWFIENGWKDKRCSTTKSKCVSDRGLSLSLTWSLPDVADTEVSCVFMERCILPCSSNVAPGDIIHWIHMTEENHIVHMYHNNQDQLEDQHQIFRNRTSLFKDQISRGNASLQLTGVKVQDEGKFECFISTNNGNKESVINLKVYAPVHEVNIQQVENRMSCSSEGIYPQPELTWSTTPPSNISLHNTTTVQQNEEQLYSISSSLILSHSHPDLVYSCTVTTPTNRRRAAWRKLTPISGSTSETIITCAASHFSFSHLLWRFNHSQMIMKQSRTDGSSTVSEEWRQQVKDVSESGDITLQDLSSEQEGI
ncbi:V-set domain-containing T-cell activation inhibitor 1-like [Acanthochromis polyacanthus]|uniref:V-set domain-containing T-cell activation inhibitor 1-like n=1 Tax=Acanthochromis polyacanthus TaxID=80966 RepID=UPI002234EA1A|nr:V-set domain-containing T-cell activation inhibitor 1-like [Acanthochromis polyacanthus]